MPRICAARDLFPPVFSTICRIRSRSISSKRPMVSIGVGDGCTLTESSPVLDSASLRSSLPTVPAYHLFLMIR